ncbi:hypothetical protein P8S54_10700 [Thiomicrospira sp. R3]|uniref:hypothetical protein n=1 Tax=Thiomicrospira sp. R3 TaxID=3035472 RepID=UPI00259BEB77|nr:hypothetical protein [Thiomicrospira sp. R3]WFE68662.1 hypothetical protein P8S54_10700 [Thiomicrospira sp. R3]
MNHTQHPYSTKQPRIQGIFCLSFIMTLVALVALQPLPLAASSQPMASERQVVLSLAQLGMAVTPAQFVVQFCPHNFNCVPFANWRLPISQHQADQLLGSQLEHILHNRYDQILINQHAATVITAHQRLENLELGQTVPALSITRGHYTAFKTQLLDYLNQHLAPNMANLLADAAQARYSEMNRQERDRFISDQARLIAMPAEVLERLVSTGYAFGFYLPPINGLVTINQIRQQTDNGRVFYLYQTALNAPISGQLVVYQFNGQDFVLKHELSAHANGFFDSLAQTLSGSATIERAFIPRPGDTQVLFDRVLERGFNDALLALNQQLSQLDEFKLSAPILPARQGLITANLGNQQAVGVKQPFRFMRTIDGIDQQVGWGFVKQPADNCLALPFEQRTLADLQLIQGAVDDYDQAQEMAWSGVYGHLAYRVIDAPLRINRQSVDSGFEQGLNLGFNASLGHLLNDPAYYYTWTNLEFTLGVNHRDDAQQTDNGLFAALNVGLSREIPLYQGLYTAFGGDIGLHTQQFNYQNQALSLSSLSLTPRMGLGMYLGPTRKLFIDINYHQPLLLETKWDGGEIEVKQRGGLGVRFGLAFKLNFSGPYAGIKTPPSQRCTHLNQTRSLHAD